MTKSKENKEKPTSKQLRAIANLQSYLGYKKIKFPKTKLEASTEIKELVTRLPQREEELFIAYAGYPF